MKNSSILVLVLLCGGCFLFVAILQLYWRKKMKTISPDFINGDTSNCDTNLSLRDGDITHNTQTQNQCEAMQGTIPIMLALNVDSLSQQSLPPSYSTLTEVDENPPPSYNECVLP